MPELATPAPATIGIELDAAARMLAAAGVYDPRRDAAGLWEAVAGIRSGQAWLARVERPDPATLARFHTAVERRAGGTPFAYAAGRMTFRRIELAIDDRALIPRPETEGLVELALRWAADAAGGLAADIGTGSGGIALSLAVEGRFDRVVATDLSSAAATLARENVARIAVPVPVEVREGDLLAPLGEERFRVIVANPPYLTEAEWVALDPAVRAFEPRLALVGGADGLDATRVLIAGAAGALEPGGLLAIEIDERRAAAVETLARVAGWEAVTIRRDLFGRSRYALMTSCGRMS